MQLSQERQPRRGLTIEQHKHEREVGLLHAAIERFVIFHRLPGADAVFTDQQDKGSRVGDRPGKLGQPQASGP